MNAQVRKTSQAALLVLLEQGLVERSDVQQQVCPVIIELIEAEDHDDYRTEAVAVRDNSLPEITILTLARHNERQGKKSGSPRPFPHERHG